MKMKVNENILSSAVMISGTKAVDYVPVRDHLLRFLTPLHFTENCKDTVVMDGEHLQIYQNVV